MDHHLGYCAVEGYIYANPGSFVTRYMVDEREVWSEYIVYGYHLEKSVKVQGVNITGVVGFLPIDSYG